MTVSTPETRVELAGDRRVIFRHIAFGRIRSATDPIGMLPWPTISEETDELLDSVQIAENIGRWGDVLAQARQDRNGAVFAPVAQDELVGLVEQFMADLREQDIHESGDHDELVACVELLSEAKDLAAELAGTQEEPSELRERPEGLSCDTCGKPGAMWEARVLPPSGRREPLCEDCARWRGALEHGEATGAIVLVGAAVALLRKTGLADSAILAAVRETMADPEYEDTYGVGGLKQIPTSKPEYESWRQAFRPLGGAA